MALLFVKLFFVFKEIICLYETVTRRKGQREKDAVSIVSFPNS